MSTLRKLSPRSQVLLAIMTLILGAAIAYWRFLPWSPKYFFGDDLSNFLAYKNGVFASNPLQAAFAAYVDKYRPVFALVLGATFAAFGTSTTAYMALNIAIQAVIAALVSLIGLRLSNGRYIPAIAAGTATAGSRFALYQVTQVTGLVESLALTFCLVTLYCLVRAREGNSSVWRWGWLAVLAAFLAMHTHERYVVLAPWVCGALFVNPKIRALSFPRQTAIVGAAAGTAAFNIVYKIIVLGLPFFVGTGGRKLGIDLDHIREQLNDALLSMGGLNSGPAYLIGTDWESLQHVRVQLLSGIFLTSWSLVVLVGGAYRIWRDTELGSSVLIQRIYWPALLLVLLGLLLTPPLLTIRLEQRWLFVPFIVALLLFTWASGAPKRGVMVPIFSIAAIAVSACSIRIDTLYSNYFGNIFFVSAGKYAEAVEHQIVNKGTSPGENLILLTDPGSCIWTLQNGDFLRYYGRGNTQYACFGSANEALAAYLPSSARIYSATTPLSFEDVTKKWNKFAQSRQGVKVFDLLEEFPKGRISDPVPVPSSPSGHGVGIMQWNSALGQRSTVTIITGFSYTFPALPISDGDQLRFAVGLIYPSPQPARVRVLVNTPGEQPCVIFSHDVLPAAREGAPQFEPMTVPLSKYSGENLFITFAVSSPGGDITGHWVGFADPRIVKSTRITALGPAPRPGVQPPNG